MTFLLHFVTMLFWNFQKINLSVPSISQGVFSCFVEVDEDAVLSDWAEAGADSGGEAAAGLEVAGNGKGGGGRLGLIRLLISSSFLDKIRRNTQCPLISNTS